MASKNYICPICGNALQHRKNGITDIWVCTGCNIVMFEFWDQTDIKNVAEDLNCYDLLFGAR